MIYIDYRGNIWNVLPDKSFNDWMEFTCVYAKEEILELIQYQGTFKKGMWFRSHKNLFNEFISENKLKIHDIEKLKML